MVKLNQIKLRRCTVFLTDLHSTMVKLNLLVDQWDEMLKFHLHSTMVKLNLQVSENFVTVGGQIYIPRWLN